MKKQKIKDLISKIKPQNKECCSVEIKENKDSNQRKEK